MTSSVLPSFSSKVTVVTAPSSLSSLVQTRRVCGVTSMYLPKNAKGFEASWPNSKRYLPPTRTSASQESKDTPADLGAHHRLSSSGLVHASNTMRVGPLKVRVTASSRSDFRSTVMRFFMGVGSLSLLASIDLLLPFQRVGWVERSDTHLKAWPPNDGFCKGSTHPTRFATSSPSMASG